MLLHSFSNKLTYIITPEFRFQSCHVEFTSDLGYLSILINLHIDNAM
jgi:hypothetical protein